LDETPHSYYEQACDDDLAVDLLARKDAIKVLREEILHIEGELLRRLEARNARILQGESYKITTGIKREITFSQLRLADAWETAQEEGHIDLFCKAFPLERKANRTHLNQLLKFGGRTAEAIERAKEKETSRIEFKVSQLVS
jgi:hypothetical protein